MNAPKTILAMESSEQAIHKRLFHRAGLCGPSVISLVEGLWGSHLLDGLWHCQRLLQLADRYTKFRLEEACRRAVFYGQGNYRTVKQILRRGADRLPRSSQTDIWGRSWNF
jgi:hypothetical protein